MSGFVPVKIVIIRRVHDKIRKSCVSRIKQRSFKPPHKLQCEMTVSDSKLHLVALFYSKIL